MTNKEQLISDITYNIIETSDRMITKDNQENNDAIAYHNNLEEFFNNILSECSEKELAYTKHLSDKLLRI